jgi:23S rRNA pseudouridine1911/1915/1917 synthase
VTGTVVLCVEPGEAGKRLDQVLALRLPQFSRSRIQALIEEGNVAVPAGTAKASLRTHDGWRIEVRIPRPRKTALVEEDLALPVLYEDDHLIVIDKPAGIVVHPGAGISSGTVVHGLLGKVRGLAGIGGEERPGIVHRLDKNTSGCLAVAKSEAALRGLQAGFKARKVEKRYRALVHGDPPAAQSLDTFFGRHPVDRKRFSSKVREGRRAITAFRVLERGGGAALLDVELLTGRTHQIRVHLADAGWPLLCDALYGGVRREARLPADAPARRAAQALGRQALHAAILGFDHPVTGARIVCEAPLPFDFRAALITLGMVVPPSRKR